MLITRNTFGPIVPIALLLLACLHLTIGIAALITTHYQLNQIEGQLGYVEPDTTLKILSGLLQVASIISALLLLLGGLIFVLWAFVAYNNLAKLQPTNAPAHRLIWSWFVPFYNIVAPYRMLLEMSVDYPEQIHKQDGKTYKKLQHLDKAAGAFWALMILQLPVLLVVEAFNADPNSNFEAQLKTEGYLISGEYLLGALTALMAFIITRGINKAEKAIIHHQRFDA